MDRDTKIIKEAAKKAPKKKEKPEDPNEVARKLRGLPKHHQVGHRVHAALTVPNGAGYRGEVVKVTPSHTFVKIDKNRIVKAPHHLVSAHEEVMQEETKEEKKERLKREAERETRSYRKYSKIENEKENHDERRKRHHEHERKMHREEDQSMKNKNEVVEANTPQQAQIKLDKHTDDLDNRLNKGDTSHKTKRVAQAVVAAYRISSHSSNRRPVRNIANPDRESIKNSAYNLSNHSKKTAADATLQGDTEKAKKFMSHSKHYARQANEETAWDSNSKKDREVEHYHIVSKSTGRVVGKAKTMKSARSARDKHDNKYGSYNHSIQPVWKEEAETDPAKAHHKKQQIQRKIIDEERLMKMFDVSADLVKTVKEVMEAKKMSKDDIAALGGDKKKVDADDFAALRAGKHKKKHKKKHHMKEEEQLDERNKDNKLKKDLHATKTGRAADHKVAGDYAERIAKDIDKEEGNDNAKKTLMKSYKKLGRSIMKNEETEISLVSKILNKYTK